MILRETSPHPRRSCRAREPVEWGRPDLVLVAPGLIWVMPAVTLLSHFGHQRAGLEPERTAMSDAIDRRRFLAQGVRTAAGVAVLGGGASSLLAACSSGGGTSTSTGTNTGVSTATPKPGGSITFATESQTVPFMTADRTPTGNAMATLMSKANPASWSVAGKRSQTRLMAEWPCHFQEFPKSPWTALPRKIAYWT